MGQSGLWDVDEPEKEIALFSARAGLSIGLWLEGGENVAIHVAAHAAECFVWQLFAAGLGIKHGVCRGRGQPAGQGGG